jgi:hypothetical protein
MTYYPNPDTTLQAYLDGEQRRRLAEQALQIDLATARRSRVQRRGRDGRARWTR